MPGPPASTPGRRQAGAFAFEITAVLPEGHEQIVIEDVEYSHRLRRAGYRILIDPRFLVRHTFHFSLVHSLRNAFRKTTWWVMYSRDRRSSRGSDQVPGAMRYSPFRHIGSAFRKRRPVQFTFFLTRRCNAGCPFCFYLSSRTGPRGPDLSFSELRTISASLGPLLWLAFSGGEVFLREDLPDIAEVFYTHNSPSIILLPTNGLLPGRIYAMTESILKRCPKARSWSSFRWTDLKRSTIRSAAYEGHSGAC